MRRTGALMALVLVGLMANAAWGASVFEIMKDIQQQITFQTWSAQGLASSPAIVNAVLAQNQKGPIPGMDNAKWKTVPENDQIVQGFIKNQAADAIREMMAKTDGIVTGAFLNAAQGEKVAFTDKTGSYIHKGSAKFDAPFTSGKAWQGPPELDDSGKVYEIQVAVPVQSEGKNIGVLIIEINGSKLEAMAKK